MERGFIKRFINTITRSKSNDDSGMSAIEDEELVQMYIERED